MIFPCLPGFQSARFSACQVFNLQTNKPLGDQAARQCLERGYPLVKHCRRRFADDDDRQRLWKNTGLRTKNGDLRHCGYFDLNKGS